MTLFERLALFVVKLGHDRPPFQNPKNHRDRGLRRENFQRTEVVVAALKSGPNLTPSAFPPEWPPRARTLTSRRIAVRLQISEREVLRWLREGDLRGLRTDNGWRVSERQLDAFLEERANIPASTRL